MTPALNKKAKAGDACGVCVVDLPDEGAEEEFGKEVVTAIPGPGSLELCSPPNFLSMVSTARVKARALKLSRSLG